MSSLIAVLGLLKAIKTLPIRCFLAIQLGQTTLSVTMEAKHG
ncbi:hypothetical protein SAMN04515659_1146 [Dyella sp. 333MFSha]|nr:hypothetical protein SAMN04515659_1146 [Dyella sp. 333MFSha]